MKNYLCLISCLFFCIAVLGDPPAAAQENTAPLTVSLSVKDEPLVTVLRRITNETGYEFKLNEEWENHPVSVEMDKLPVDQGLKRLLKSLNHTIVWESEKSATIMVYGKVEPGKKGAVSFAPPPRTEQVPVEADAEPESGQEPEPEEAGEEEAGEEEAGEEETQEKIMSDEDLAGS